MLVNVATLKSRLEAEEEVWLLTGAILAVWAQKRIWTKGGQNASVWGFTFCHLWNRFQREPQHTVKMTRSVEPECSMGLLSFPNFSLKTSGPEESSSIQRGTGGRV